MIEFKLPSLGEGVDQGELLHWHVAPGDDVVEDDPLVEVETDKAAVTIPSPGAGRIVSLHGSVGDSLPVGAVLCVIDDSPAEQPKRLGKDAEATDLPDAASTSASSGVASVQGSVAPKPAPAVSLSPPTSGRPGLPVPAAPATRRKARELGVDLREVPGSGPGGRVTAEDLAQFAVQRGAGAVDESATGGPTGPGIPFFGVEPLPDFGQWGEIEKEPVRSIRRKVAQKMVASMVIVPHVAHFDEADVTELDAARRRQNGRLPDVKLTLLPFVMRAVVSQLKRYPQFNASIDPIEQQIIYKKYYNVGFAADTPRGLMVPVVHDAAALSVLQTAAEVQRLAEQARDGALDVVALRGGTFTITNVGSLGGTGIVPAINYPEVAILGLGRAQDKPVVRDGQIVVRKMLPMTLSYDHRLIDGADAARFVSAIAASLSDPVRLLIED